MSDFDITLVLTAHSETVVAGPAVQSANAAVLAAEVGGYTVEKVIGLDAASDACRSFLTQPAFSEWKLIELDMGDVGHTRNAITEVASGRWIAFLDADDLFSENWLVAGAKRLAQAEADKERVIVHPEINWFFDGAASVLTKPEQDDFLVTPYYFYFGNFYDALCMAPVKAHLEIPCVHRDIPNGLSFQDWQWGIETAAGGWRHVIAKDTIIFKRRRDNSLVTESSGRRAIIRALEAMAIDRIGKFGET